MLVVINICGGIARLVKGHDSWLERYCGPMA